MATRLDAVRRPGTRWTNLALLLLLSTSLATGGLAFATGTRWVRLVLVAHAVAGLGLLVVAPAKISIARRGLARREPASTWPSLGLAAAVTVAVATGVLHSTGLVLRYGPLDDMQVHVGAALATLPLGLWHIASRGVGPGHGHSDRRALLRTALLLGSAGALAATQEGVAAAADLPGARRRHSGSFEQGSHDPRRMPRTIWLFDPEPVIDPSKWRLTVATPGTERRLALEELAVTDHVTAVLDCTGGWWAEQDWAGVRLDRLLGPLPASVRSVHVTSQTGYARRFPVRDLDRLWLATHYEGQPLLAGHGAPARLVAPGRRGFWWVKWVVRITTDPLPWWRQPPFPLQ